MSETATRRTYKNAPIEEAIVEFRFKPDPDWDLTIYGKLAEQPEIKNAYRGKPRQQKTMEAALRTGPEQAPSFAVREGPGRFQLVNDDATQLLSLAPDTLSISLLRPYSSWHNFRSRVEAALKAYQEVAKPKAVTRMGVRYINKIVLPLKDEAIKLDSYFICGPPAAPGLPRKLGGFMSRGEYIHDDGVKLFLTQASVEAPENFFAVLLDLDVIWEGSEASDLASAMSIIDDLHDREGQAFEATITDETRAVFDA